MRGSENNFKSVSSNSFNKSMPLPSANSTSKKINCGFTFGKIFLASLFELQTPSIFISNFEWAIVFLIILEKN